MFYLILARYRYWLLAGCLLVVLGGALAALPAYRFFKNWRAETLAGEAMQYLEEGSLAQAEEQIGAAVHLSPANPLVRKTYARFLRFGGSSRTLDYWGELEKDGLLNNEDWLEYAKTALLFKQPHEALRIIQAAVASSNSSESILLFGQQLAFALEKYELSIDFSEQLLARDSDHKKAMLGLIAAKLKQEDSAVRDEAISLVDSIDLENVALGIDALLLVAENTDVAQSIRLDVLASLLNRPSVNPTQYLRIKKIQLSLQPELRNDVVEEILGHLASEEPSQQTLLGRWLNQEGFYSQVLEVISMEQAKKNVDLFGIRMDALAQLERWDEIHRILRDDRTVPINDFMRQLYLFRSLKEQGLDEEANFRWTRAIMPGTDLKNYFDRLQRAGVYAEALGYYSHAKMAYSRLQENSLTARQGFIALFRVARLEGDTEELIQLLETMRAKYPQEKAVINDLNYYNLLLGNDIQESLASAYRLYTENPRQMAYRVTLAFAFLRVGDFQKADTLLDIPELDWCELQDIWKFVKQLSLKSQNKPPLPCPLNLNKLLPEEKNLIETMN